MVFVKHPYSFWLQLSSLSFCAAGNFSDLLIIRLCLTTAYLFLLLNCSLGSPLWPSFHIPHTIQLDGMIWAIINLYVHITTVLRLLNDERPVDLSLDQQALWRMFYRTGGLSQKLYQSCIGKYCTVCTAQHNDVLNTIDYFYIIYEGIIQITITDDDNEVVIATRFALSGQIFDFRSLGMLTDQYSQSNYTLTAIVISNTAKLFRFHVTKLQSIVTNPATRLLWKEILMESLLRIVERYLNSKSITNKTSSSNDGSTIENKNNYTSNPNYMNPIFAPLEENELPHPLRAGSTMALRNPLGHIFQYMVWSFAPPWPFRGPPVGLRHTQLLVGTGTKIGGGSKHPLPHYTVHPAVTATGPIGNSSASALNNNNIHPDEIITHGPETTPITGRTYQSTVDRNDISKNTLSLDYINDLDEEMGGINFINFKTATALAAAAAAAASNAPRPLS